jgi:RNA polymerase sigma-70 factor (ECF subfamily)
MEGVPAGEAAKQTGLSPGAVYVAKSRVLARLKEAVEALRAREDV